MKMEIFWTRHAEERQKEWEEKLGISCQEVENILKKPQQVVSGDRGVLIAQAIRGNGLLRIVFSEVKETRKILTLYWTTRIERYWEARPDEDEI